MEIVLSLGQTVRICLGTFLVSSAFGSVLGMVNYRFGKVVAVVTGIGIIGIGGGVAFCLTAVDAGWLDGFLNRCTLDWVFLAVCAVLYLLPLFPECRIIRGYQVRQ